MTSSGAPGEYTSELSTKEFHAVFDAVNDGIFVHDEHGTIIDVNQAAVEMYGYSRSTLKAKGLAGASSGTAGYTEDDAEAYIQRTLDGEPQEFEWQARDSDGNVFWVDVSLSQMVIDGTARVLAVVRDIDDRKEAERRFRTLIDNLPGIVYRCRNEHGWPIEFVGGQCEEVTGYEADEIESGTVGWGTEVIHPDDKAEVRKQVKTGVENGEPFETSYRIRTAAGNIRWVWERGQQFDTPESNAGILEGFITDITEQKAVEERLERQRDGVEMLNQILRHDIRNDLQLVTVYAGFLMDKCEREEVQGYIEMIEENATHAVELTRTARDMATVMLSDETQLTDVHLRPTLSDEFNTIRSEASDATVELQSPIPATTVRANELLGSVFRNVLKNAIQHNDKEQPKVTIDVRNREETVLIEIADNGPGIPDEQKEAIFGKGETRLASAGTGIGLYLVETLVDTYGGEVQIRDDDPDGVVFAIELLKSN